MKIGCSEVPKPTYPSLLWLAEWKAPAPFYIKEGIDVWKPNSTFHLFHLSKPKFCDMLQCMFHSLSYGAQTPLWCNIHKGGKMLKLVCFWVNSFFVLGKPGFNWYAHFHWFLMLWLCNICLHDSEIIFFEMRRLFSLRRCDYFPLDDEIICENKLCPIFRTAVCCRSWEGGGGVAEK